MIRILLVDDQKTVRESLKAWLEPVADFKIVGTASDGYSAIEQVEILKPDVVLIDMEMPVLDGVQTTEMICQKFLGVKVIVLSMHDKNEYVLHALQAGATGYLLKNTPKKELIEAISFVHRGYSQVAPGLMSKLVAHIPQSSNGQVLPQTKIPQLINLPNSISSQKPKPRNKKTYVAIWLLGNLVIWGGSLLYLQLKQPTYTSKWTIALPASNTSTNIDLPDVGQASSQSESPYNSDFSDPRENYKYLAQTSEVLETAANSLHMDLAEFGKPKIETPGNTTLIEFQIAGDNPAIAKDKAMALQTALEKSLKRLRNDENGDRGQNLQSTLQEATQKLDNAREKLAQFKINSGLSSVEQPPNLISNIEQLRRERAEIIAQEQKIKARLNQLIINLGLSTQEASDALILQSDPQFKEYVSNYAQVSRELVNLKAKFSNTHPSVIAKQAEQAETKSEFYRRGEFLLGKPFSETTLKNLNINSDDSFQSQRAVFFQELISLQAEQKGLASQATTLGKQITALETQLATISQHEAQLQKLTRDVQLAEAVSSSTATRLELNKSQTSASYPPISLLSSPNLPKTASAPKKAFILLGSMVSSILLTTGLLSLWLRNKGNQKTLYPPLIGSKNNNNNHQLPVFCESDANSAFNHQS